MKNSVSNAQIVALFTKRFFILIVAVLNKLLKPLFALSCIDRNRFIKKPVSILFIQLLNIGDAVVSTPAINALRISFPTAKISVLANQNNVEVFNDNPHVDEVLVYRTMGFLAYLRFLIDLRKRKFDIVFDLQNSFFSTQRFFMSFFSGGAVRIGFKRKWFEGFLNNHEVVWVPGLKHEVQSYLDIVRIFCGNINNPKMELFFSRSNADVANKVLGIHGVSKNDRLVCIHPVSKNVSRLWDIEKFAEVCEYLTGKKLVKVVFTGLKDDADYIRNILRFVPGKGINLAGELDLKNLFALLSRSCLLISVDTSLVHIASALKVPTVAIYGPTNPTAWSPWDTLRQRMVRKNLSCSPCEVEFDKVFICKHKDYPCIRGVTSAEVISAAEDLLVV